MNSQEAKRLIDYGVKRGWIQRGMGTKCSSCGSYFTMQFEGQHCCSPSCASKYGNKVAKDNERRRKLYVKQVQQKKNNL